MRIVEVSMKTQIAWKRRGRPPLPPDLADITSLVDEKDTPVYSSARVLLPKTVLHGLAGRSRRARRTSRTPSGAGTSINKCCVRSTRTNPKPGGTSEHRAARIGDSNDPAAFTLPELSSVNDALLQSKLCFSPAQTRKERL